jgi:hypothetical protein
MSERKAEGTGALAAPGRNSMANPLCPATERERDEARAEVRRLRDAIKRHQKRVTAVAGVRGKMEPRIANALTEIDNASAELYVATAERRR